MNKTKELTENEKLRIADLYHNTRMSIGFIADALGFCPDTIRKYKDYKQSG